MPVSASTQEQYDRTWVRLTSDKGADSATPAVIFKWLKRQLETGKYKQNTVRTQLTVLLLKAYPPLDAERKMSALEGEIRAFRDVLIDQWDRSLETRPPPKTSTDAVREYVKTTLAAKAEAALKSLFDDKRRSPKKLLQRDVTDYVVASLHLIAPLRNDYRSLLLERVDTPLSTDSAASASRKRKRPPPSRQEIITANRRTVKRRKLTTTTEAATAAEAARAEEESSKPNVIRYRVDMQEVIPTEIIIRQHKTAKAYGSITVPLEAFLSKGKNFWLLASFQYLIVTSKNGYLFGPMSSPVYSRMMTRIFSEFKQGEEGHGVGSTILRRAFLSGKYSDVHAASAADAATMAHSVATQQKVYVGKK